MNFKKTIAKSLIVAMALGMVPVANLQTAKAAVTDVEFAGATGIVTLKGATDNAPAYWGIAKEVKKEGKDTVKIGGKDYKITNVQEYYKEIDAYALLKGKGGIIAGGDTATPDNNWKILEIKPAEVLQVQYASKKDKFKGLTGEQANAMGGEYGYLLATKKDGKSFVPIALDSKIEAKLNDGSWQTLDKFFGAAPANDNVTQKLHSYGQTGSTITFRIAGTAAAWASKESKLKISGPAKGPSVKVDPTKGTTSIKKGMQWQKVELENNVKPSDAWTTADKAVSFKDLGLTAGKGYAIFVRTAPTDKKIASSITRVDLKKPAEAVTAETELTAAGAIGNDLKVALVVPYDINKGATLSNSNKDKTFEYAFAKTLGEVTKWNTLKAATTDKKTSAIKPAVAKLAYSATEKANTWGAAGMKFFVREAGAKQKGNELTLPGVAAGLELKLTNVAQAFKVFNEGSTKPDGTDLTVTDASNTATIKMKAKTAGQFVIKSQLEKAVKTGKNAKVKLKTSGIKGIAVKAGDLNDSGKFDLTIDVKNSVFKEAPSGTLTIDVNYEGVKGGKLVITFQDKT